MAKSPAWTRKEGKNPKGGLNAKGRASAKAQGMNLKPPVKKAEAAKSPMSDNDCKSACIDSSVDFFVHVPYKHLVDSIITTNVDSYTLAEHLINKSKIEAEATK